MQVGSKVKFRSAFLQSVGWYTDVPGVGVVTEVHDPIVIIDWNDGHGPTSAHIKNIMLADKPDYSGM